MARVYGSPRFAYNTQVHRSTNMAPFNLFLSQSPPSVAIQAETTPSESFSRDQARLQFLSQIRKLVTQSRSSLAKAQEKYKKYFDRHVRPLAKVATGDMVYLERQASSSQETGRKKRRHKLSPKADGPYPVVSTTDHTITIVCDGLNEKVYRNRVAKFPPLPAAPARQRRMWSFHVDISRRKIQPRVRRPMYSIG